MKSFTRSDNASSPRLETVSCRLGRQALYKTSEGARASAELAPGYLCCPSRQRHHEKRLPQLVTPAPHDRLPRCAPPPPSPPPPWPVPSPALHGAGGDHLGAPRPATPPRPHRRRRYQAAARDHPQRQARAFPLIHLRVGLQRAAREGAARSGAVGAATEVLRTPPGRKIPATAGGRAPGRPQNMRTRAGGRAGGSLHGLHIYAVHATTFFNITFLPWRCGAQ